MKLSEKDIQFGFWNINLREPKYLKFDDPNIRKEKSLGIGFYDEYNKAREIKEWNKKIESLDNVEYLWTYHKLNQETFDIIARMKSLKGLNIKWSSIKTIKAIENLERLQNLDLGLSTGIIDLSPIISLKNLITFETENLKRINNWDVLKYSNQLEGLGVSGGMYQTLKLDSLDFLQGLENLKYLFLISTSIKDKSLKPLENLKKLECLRIGGRWKEGQFKTLRENLPRLKFGNVALDGTTRKLNDIFKSKKNG